MLLSNDAGILEAVSNEWQIKYFVVICTVRKKNCLMLSHALLCTAHVFLGHVSLGGGVHSVRMCEEQQHKVNNRGGHAS